MNNSTNSTKSPNRKTKCSSFQELQLYMSEIEVIHPMKVYCTETTSFFFTLKKPQADSIKQNRKSIFFRFCSFEHNKAVQKDYLPKDVNLLINGCSFMLESKNSNEKNWKTPLDITHRCRAVTTRNANSFEINLNSSRKLMQKGYGIEVVLARKLPINETLNLLKSNLFIRKAEETLKIIKNSFSANDEIQLDAVKVPLTCPVTRKVIQLPLIGQNCKHVNCFEGDTFLQMHLNKPEWTCPVCYNLIRKNELLRDPFIEDILHSTQRKVDQIEFDQLGNFKAAEPETSKPKQRSKLECVVLDDEEDDHNNEPTVNEPLVVPKLEAFFNFPSSSSTSNQQPFNSSNILNSLNLVSTNRSSSTTTLPSWAQRDSHSIYKTNRTLNSQISGNVVREVIELSSDDDDENSIIVIDSDSDDINHSNNLNDSHNSDDSNLTNYSFFASNIQRGSDAFDNNSNDSFNNTDDDNHTDVSIDSDNNSTDQTELDSDEDEIYRRNQRRRVYSSSDMSLVDRYSENTSISSISSTSSLSSTNASNNRSNDENSSFASSSLLQSRGSLRRRRKRQRIQYDSDESSS